MPEVNRDYLDEKLEEKWNKLLEIRGEIYKAIEQARADKSISHPLEARIEVSCGQGKVRPAEVHGKEHAFASDRFRIRVYQKVRITSLSKKRRGKKCERCWMHLDTVGKDHRHPTLCDRCAEVVNKI